MLFRSTDVGVYPLPGDLGPRDVKFYGSDLNNPLKVKLGAFEVVKARVDSITPNESVAFRVIATMTVLGDELNQVQSVKFFYPTTHPDPVRAGMEDTNITTGTLYHPSNGELRITDVGVYPLPGDLGPRDVKFYGSDLNNPLKVKLGGFEVVPNSPPVLDAIGNKSVSEGRLLTFTVHATDPNGDTMTYSVQRVGGSLPSGVSFNGTTGAFSWTPSYTQSGTYSFIFTATDGELSDTKQITATVVDVPTGGGGKRSKMQVNL